MGNRVEKHAASLEAMADNNEKTQNRGGGAFTAYLL